MYIVLVIQLPKPQAAGNIHANPSVYYDFVAEDGQEEAIDYL